MLKRVVSQCITENQLSIPSQTPISRIGASLIFRRS